MNKDIVIYDNFFFFHGENKLNYNYEIISV